MRLRYWKRAVQFRFGGHHKTLFKLCRKGAPSDDIRWADVLALMQFIDAKPYGYEGDHIYFIVGDQISEKMPQPRDDTPITLGTRDKLKRFFEAANITPQNAIIVMELRDRYHLISREHAISALE